MMDENDAKIAVELGKCPQMAYLRQELARRGYDFTTGDEVREDSITGYRYVMLRTHFRNALGFDTSVIWGYTEYHGTDKYYSTYGAPDMLECWPVMGIGDPVPMTVDRILRECA